MLQENYNTPRYRTPQAIPRSPTMKGIPAYSLLVKVARGVFQRCVETTLEMRVAEKSLGNFGNFQGRVAGGCLVGC